MKTLVVLLTVALIGVSCTKEQLSPQTSGASNSGSGLKSENGIGSAREVFYDDSLFVVNMMELNSSEKLIAHNGSINEIYAYADLDDEQPFLSVIDAIQGDGFNPLWEQELIVFNAGFTPRQLTSEEDVDAAVASGEITLQETDEVYRCSVIGKGL